MKAACKSVSVVNNILQKQHIVEGQSVEVQAYLEGIGVIPLGHDTSKPAVGIPSDIDMPIVPPCILQFWLSSAQIQQKIQEELEGLHCAVYWPSKSTDPLRLSCELDPDLPDVQSLALNWGNKSKEAVSTIRDEFETKSIQPQQEAWKSIIDLCATTGNKDVLDIQVDPNRFEILLVGRKDEVLRKTNELNAVLQDIIDAKNRDADSTTEIIDSISLPHLRLLLAHEFPTTIKSKFPHLKYTIKDGQVIMKGAKIDILHAQVETLAYIRTTFESSVVLSPGLRKLVERKDVGIILTKKMSEQNVNATWETTEDGVKMYSLDKGGLQKSKTIINNMLLEKKITLSPKSCTVLLGKTWRVFEDGVNSNMLTYVCVQSTEDGKVVIVDAVDNMFEETFKEVEQFLAAHPIVESFIDIPWGVARLLNNHMQTELEEIQKSATEGIELEILSTESDHGVKLKGDSTAIDSANHRVHTLIGKVQDITYPVTKAGMAKVLSVKKGLHFCKSLETEMKTTVDIVKNVQQAPANKPGKGNILQPQVKSKVKIENAMLFLVKGDLPTYRADAIVNAANQDLQHLDGLAKAIITAGSYSSILCLRSMYMLGPKENVWAKQMESCSYFLFVLSFYKSCVTNGLTCLSLTLCQKRVLRRLRLLKAAYVNPVMGHKARLIIFGGLRTPPKPKLVN